MKNCPACKTQYSDDTLQFCLQDGTPLEWMGQAETQTVVLGETETVVGRGGQGRVNIPVADPNQSAWQPSQVTHVATAMPEKKGSNTMLAVLITAVGMLILFGIIGLAALFFWKNAQRASVGNTNDANLTGWNVNGGNVNSGTYSKSPMPTSTRPSSTPVATPTATPVSPPPPPPPPSELKSYPATARLKFPRGAYSTSFGGDLNPSGSRSLVLACRSGQSLSANISGGGGCVSFRGGGTSTRIYTNSGDNYLTLVNNCSTVVHFSVSVTII